MIDLHTKLLIESKDAEITSLRMEIDEANEYLDKLALPDGSLLTRIKQSHNNGHQELIQARQERDYWKQSSTESLNQRDNAENLLSRRHEDLAALRQSEERYHAALEGVWECLYNVDDACGLCGYSSNHPSSLSRERQLPLHEKWCPIHKIYAALSAPTEKPGES